MVYHAVKIVFSLRCRAITSRWRRNFTCRSRCSPKCHTGHRPLGIRRFPNLHSEEPHSSPGNAIRLPRPPAPGYQTSLKSCIAFSLHRPAQFLFFLLFLFCFSYTTHVLKAPPFPALSPRPSESLVRLPLILPTITS
jgi:hypothetical protein